jgi:hypothetical protein
MNVTAEEIPGRLSRAEAERVVELAEQYGIAEPLVRRFAVGPLTPDTAGAAGTGPATTTSYVIVERRGKAKDRRSGIMITALQVGEEFTNVRAAHSK